MIPRIVQTALHGIDIGGIAVDAIEFDEPAYHHGREPHVALADDTECLTALGREFPEEIIVAFIARSLVKQGTRLYHLAAVVGELRTADIAVERHVIEIEPVPGVEQVLLRPGIEPFALLEVAAVARRGIEFQCIDGARCIGTGILRIFLLFAPVDAAAQHIVRAALDEFPDHLGLGEVFLVARSLVDIAEVDAQPHVVVVETIRGRSRIDIGGISRRHTRRIEVLGQPRQHAVVEHAAIGGILLEDRIHSRERSREGPQVGIGIRTRLVFGGKVPRLVTGIERIVFAQQAAVGDTIISIDRIERCLGTVEVAGLARRRPVTGGKSTCGNCRSGEEECFLHYLLSVIRWVSGWYTAPASYGGPC